GSRPRNRQSSVANRETPASRAGRAPTRGSSSGPPPIAGRRLPPPGLPRRLCATTVDRDAAPPAPRRPPAETPAPGSNPPGSTPYLLRHFDDEAELGLLLLDRQRVAVDGRGEAALRRQA